MAALAFGIVGAALAPAGYAAVGWSLGVMAANLLKKPEVQRIEREGPRLKDPATQTSSYGAGIPHVYGRCVTAGTLIWQSERREVATTTTTSQRTGKGGGGSRVETTTTTYSYFRDFAILVCRGPIQGILRIWENGALIYDVSNTASTATVIASAAQAGDLTIYTGFETQLPDPTMEAALGSGNVPAYRDRAYIVFRDKDLTQFGGNVQQYEFEVVTAGTTANLANPLIDAVNSGAGMKYPRGDTFIVAPLDVTGATTWRIYSAFSGALVRSMDWSSGGGITVQGLGGVWGTIGRPSQDGDGNWWTQYTGRFSGHPTWGASVRMFLVGLRPNGEIFKVIYAGPYGGGGTNESELAVRGRYAIFRWQNESSTAIWRIDLVTAPDVRDMSSVTLTHREQIWTHPSATLYRLVFEDLDGVSHWPIIDTTAGVAYVYRMQGTEVVQSANISGFNTADYVNVSFDCGFVVDQLNRLWAYWFEGTGSARRGVFKRFDFATGAILQTITLPEIGGTAMQQSIRSPVFAADGYLYVAYASGSTPGIWYKVDVASGAVVAQTGTNHPPNDGGGIATRYGVFAGGMNVSHPGVRQIEPIPRITVSSPPTVASAVNSICDLAGLLAADRSAGALSDALDGFLLARPMSARSAIELLQKAYFFDVVESDGVVKFVKRGGASAVTIPADELGARRPGEPAEPALRMVRGQETEVPEQITVSYWNKDADYEDAAEYDRRRVVETQEQAFEELPLALSPTKAAQVANVLLYDAHNERNRFTWRTGQKYARFEPTDVVSLQDEVGNTYTVRVTRKREDGLLIYWEGVNAYAPLFTSASTGATTQTGQSGVFSAVPLVADLLDIPILRSVDDNAGFYAALSGVAPGAQGGILLGSGDATNYEQLGSVSTVTVRGYAATALAASVFGNVCDKTNTVEIECAAGAALSSVTEDELYNGANLCLLGDELLQFQIATLVSGSRYRIANLLRGRRGTERFMTTHAAGERFVLLGANGMLRVTRPAAELNTTRYYKAVPFGGSLADSAAAGFSNTGNGLRPLPVADLRAWRNFPSSNDWTVTATRRGRIDWDWRDYGDVPLGEASESYDVEIINISSNAVVRTFTVTTPSIEYTAAQQTTDFGAVQSTIRTRWFQKSATVGRGMPAEETFSG